MPLDGIGAELIDQAVALRRCPQHVDRFLQAVQTSRYQLGPRLASRQEDDQRIRLRALVMIDISDCAVHRAGPNGISSLKNAGPPAAVSFSGVASAAAFFGFFSRGAGRNPSTASAKIEREILVAASLSMEVLISSLPRAETASPTSSRKSSSCALSEKHVIDQKAPVPAS